jgi:hypothetical protein
MRILHQRLVNMNHYSENRRLRLNCSTIDRQAICFWTFPCRGSSREAPIAGAPTCQPGDLSAAINQVAEWSLWSCHFGPSAHCHQHCRLFRLVILLTCGVLNAT